MERDRRGRPDGSSVDRVLEVALIGYGLGGSVFHAPLIEATEGLRVNTVVTANPRRAHLAQANHPGVRILPTADALWADPGPMELVVVASPNRWHVTHALAAIKAGRAVVVDKPVAGTLTDVRRLATTSKQAGVPVSVFHNRRWDGDFRTVRDLLDKGELGQVHRFESRFERWRPTVAGGTWKESDDPEDLGGILYDLGSHLVDQALTLFGPAVAIYAEQSLTRPGALADDDAFVALTHAGGVRSHLWMSAVAADLGPRMRVLGSAAAYVTHGMDSQEAALRAGGRPDTDPDWGAVPAALWGRLGTPERAVPVPTVAGAYQEFYALLRDALRTGSAVPVPIEEAMATVAVLDAARVSARTGAATAPAGARAAGAT